MLHRSVFPSEHTTAKIDYALLQMKLAKIVFRLTKSLNRWYCRSYKAQVLEIALHLTEVKLMLKTSPWLIICTLVFFCKLKSLHNIRCVLCVNLRFTLYVHVRSVTGGWLTYRIKCYKSEITWARLLFKASCDLYSKRLQYTSAQWNSLACVNCVEWLIRMCSVFKPFLYEQQTWLNLGAETSRDPHIQDYCTFPKHLNTWYL